MARVVVIASAEVDRAALDSVLDEEDELYVLVPAVEQSRLQWLTNDEGEARAEAERVGKEVARDAPTDAESIAVSPDTPTQLVRDAIAVHEPDRVVVAVRADEDATWLEEHELEALPPQVDGVPVTRLALT